MLRRFVSRFAGLVRLAAERWAGSLRLRVAIMTSLIGVVGVALVGAILGTTIRDGLFDTRRDEVVADAAARTELAQQRFDAATANTVPQVQALATDVYALLQGPGSGAMGTMLLRTPGGDSQPLINEPVTDTRLLEPQVLGRDLRRAVSSGGIYWQSVSLPESMGAAPAIIVGTQVNLPIVGAYELYNVYSLGPEEGTLLLVTRVLAAGGIAIIILLGVMTWWFTQRVLSPVKEAAHIAERLADGLLDERMAVRGRDELATLGRSFNEMAESLQDQIEQLAELSRLQQRFVSDVSHELRTPLTTIRMAAEMLYDAREDFPPTVQRSAELLYAQIDRFESMLADLLEISRFDAGAAELEVEHIDVLGVVQRAVDLAEPLAERLGSHITLSSPGRPTTADVDARRLERIVRNLLNNAIEHSEGKGVDVTVGVDDAVVAIMVRDYGVGMTADDAAHVFDRFWRADPARARTTGGTGLGLAICLEDARLHDGTLESWGRPGQGAAFRLRLPRRAGLSVISSPVLLPDEEEAALVPTMGAAAVPRFSEDSP